MTEHVAPHPFLDLVSPASREALLAVAETVQVAKGTVIFHLGDEGDGLYEVVKGRVKITRTEDESDPRREALMRVVGPGQLCGELAAFDGGPRNGTATAATTVVLRRYPQAEIETLVSTRPDVATACLTLVTDRLRHSLERSAETQILDGPTRLARCILNLAARFAEMNGSEIYVRHGLTQLELGGLVGLSRESVSKQLTALEQTGCITVGSGYIVVRDHDALTRAADL